MAQPRANDANWLTVVIWASSHPLDGSQALQVYMVLLKRYITLVHE